MDALGKELPEYTFDFSPIAHFGADLIRNQPREARELGCEPDFDAWNRGKANPKPNAEVPFRTASGHVHIGWTEEQDITDPDHLEACNMFSKQLDFMLGIPSLLWDDDVTRRLLYGKAGCYRPKSYGMEYRTLSNVWLKNPEHIDFVVAQSIDAFKALVDQQNYSKNAIGLREMVNDGEWKKATQSYTRHIMMPKFLIKLYDARDKADRIAKAIVDKELLNKHVAKGDVDGKGFPANHLAKVAWGRRKIIDNEVALGNDFDLEMAQAAPVGLRPGMIVDWDLLAGLGNPQPRPADVWFQAPAPIPILDEEEDF